MIRFFDWAYRDGAAIAAQLDYIPLPAPALERVRAAWASLDGDAVTLSH